MNCKVDSGLAASLQVGSEPSVGLDKKEKTNTLSLLWRGDGDHQNTDSSGIPRDGDCPDLSEGGAHLMM